MDFVSEKLMDIFDDATAQEELHRELSIQQARANNQPLKFSGHCLYCNEQITQGRYCSVECREDGEMERVIRARQFR